MSETDMTEYAELRVALAAGPAIGPYIVDQDNGNGIVVVDGRGNIVAEANYGDVPSEYGPGVTETIIRDVRSTHLYIAAANPTTIATLLVERDALRAEVDRLNRYYKNGIDCFANPCERHSGERTPPFAEFFEKYGGQCLICVVDNNKALQAENERLKEQLRLATVDQATAEAEANDAHAENKRLREALEDILSRSSMNLAMNPNPFELTAMLGDIHQIADAALSKENE